MQNYCRVLIKKKKKHSDSIKKKLRFSNSVIHNHKWKLCMTHSSNNLISHNSYIITDPTILAKWNNSIFGKKIFKARIKKKIARKFVAITDPKQIFSGSVLRRISRISRKEQRDLKRQPASFSRVLACASRTCAHTCARTSTGRVLTICAHEIPRETCVACAVHREDRTSVRSSSSPRRRSGDGGRNCNGDPCCSCNDATRACVTEACDARGEWKEGDFLFSHPEKITKIVPW